MEFLDIQVDPIKGVNMLAFMTHKDVDATRTISNHLIEVIGVLGIEAVGPSFLSELRAVISFDGLWEHIQDQEAMDGKPVLILNASNELWAKAREVVQDLRYLDLWRAMLTKAIEIFEDQDGGFDQRLLIWRDEDQDSERVVVC